MAKMLDILLGEAAMGVKEIPGAEANPRIMEYLDTTTIRATDDITPWCSACINWVAIKAGYKGTDSAASATWRNWGKGLKKPSRGCVIGFVRKDGSGHVGLFISEDADTYTILGGNQGDQVKISRFKKISSKETRDWYFRSPKTPFNSKVVGGSAGGVGAIVLNEYPDYESLIKEWRKSKDRAIELQQEVKELKEPTLINAFDSWFPFIMIGLLGFIVYDRVKDKMNGHLNR